MIRARLKQKIDELIRMNDELERMRFEKYVNTEIIIQYQMEIDRKIKLLKSILR